MMRKLTYKGNEQAWQFVNGPWHTNEDGDMIVPAAHVHTREQYKAFNTEHAYADCVVSGKWQLRYAGGAHPQLIVRALDSWRFYAVRFDFQGEAGVTSWWTHPAVADLPGQWQEHVMASIWKSGPDGYQRMVGYRRKVGLYHGGTHPHLWYSVRVECVGPEIRVFFEDRFVCAIRDDEYKAGVIGVGSTYGHSAWKDLAMDGRPVELQPPWFVVEDKAPRQITVFKAPTPGGMGAVNASATLLPGDEILAGYVHTGKQWVTRSRDYGLTWDEPVQGRCVTTYLPSLDELWWYDWQHPAEIVWEDKGTDSDNQKTAKFSIGLSRSKDGGRTWSEIERMKMPFPSGQLYQPLPDNGGGKMGAGVFGQFRDGSIGCIGGWSNTPSDGFYHSGQVQFLRSIDGGRTWSINPVDANTWDRNESSWVELPDGNLLCVMRSNYECSLGVSRSPDKGKTWNRVTPVISFFGASAPALLHTRDNILVLATRGWGLFTSFDNGYTWSLPTHIGGFTGSGWEAHLSQMSDGRILVLGDDDEQTIKAQFITIDRQGVIHPALPGPVE